MGNMIFQCKCCDRNKWNKDEEKNEIRKEKNENNYLTENDLRIIIKNGFSKQNYDEKSNGLKDDSLNLDFQNKNNNENLIPKDEYSKYMFENINDIRQNPKNYIDLIKKSKKNILIKNNGRIIYNSKLKVSLFKGEEAFDDAIKDLKNSKKTNKLIFSPEITIEPSDNEEDLKSKDYLRKKASENKNIKGFWKDIIFDSEIAFILMIVDDEKKFPGKKRKSLLDPNMKYIGLSSKKIGNNFCCYFILNNSIV